MYIKICLWIFRYTYITLEFVLRNLEILENLITFRDVRILAYYSELGILIYF